MSKPPPGRRRASKPAKSGGKRVAPRTRPRYARISLFGASTIVTLVAVLGGIGVLPSGGHPTFAAARVQGGAEPQGQGTTQDPAQEPAQEKSGAISLTGAAHDSAPGRSASSRDVEVPVPADSGSGRRVVFDMSAQRVWLVTGNDKVRRSYLVSGSVTDNLGPGTYSVYSRSERAVGIDDSGTMEFMVRFTRGERAAIGFHSIPELDGELVQTRAQLGTPQSHGCIRQWRRDAKALWDFAPIGTAVVVTA